jgi:hypothetical protein
VVEMLLVEIETEKKKRKEGITTLTASFALSAV